MSVLLRPDEPLVASGGLTGRQAWGLVTLLFATLFVWLIVAVWPGWLNAVLISKKAFVSAVLNGLTLAGLYFLVASGFTLVFGLMRNVNLAHGSFYLLGAYIGYEVATRTGSWLVGVAAGFVILALVGVVMQVLVFRRIEGDELRQTMVTIGISIVAADLMLAVWTGGTYQICLLYTSDAAGDHGDPRQWRCRLSDLSDLSAGCARRGDRDRAWPLARFEPNPRWHDDPRWRR